MQFTKRSSYNLINENHLIFFYLSTILPYSSHFVIIIISVFSSSTFAWLLISSLFLTNTTQHKISINLINIYKLVLFYYYSSTTWNFLFSYSLLFIIFFFASCNLFIYSSFLAFFLSISDDFVSSFLCNYSSIFYSDFPFLHNFIAKLLYIFRWTLTVFSCLFYFLSLWIEYSTTMSCIIYAM